MQDLTFDGRAFCFTGSMSQLKRTMAEREVRARNGLSQKVINKELSYLVVGSIPSPAWKYGDYGNKINKARDLIKKGAKLKIISEAFFINGLESVIPIDSGEIDEKILICRYKSFLSKGEFDLDGVKEFLALTNEAGFHITASIEEPYIYSDLYNEYTTEEVEGLLLLQCRFVKKLAIETDCQDITDAIAMGFEAIQGVDGDFSFSEKIEGSASYAKLFLAIPETKELANY